MDREAFYRKELQMRFFINEAQQRCAILYSSPLRYSLLIASWELGAAYAAFIKFEVAFEKWLILCTNQNKR
jgi:hypothetical protein